MIPRARTISVAKKPRTGQKQHMSRTSEVFTVNATKVYWFIFKEFNIKFNFPRSDTCVQCDIYKQKLNEKNLSEEELATLTAEGELHLRKADAFFDLKTRYKAKVEAGKIECLTFDFMQNLPLPYIPSNPAIYACQLWYYVLGIHNLGSKEVTIYTYH
ncbi:hypothetical protein ILUMI_02098 [Ignelater luminosus]|uniref:Uncharacterized protein n=1 Tax=Ignelater luminosus TaxID=2038154 RepID=A0A8K0GLM8_IGNLU|nr:hypothetical protein ILUMI_02098 [Ignelater luminosus]